MADDIENAQTDADENMSSAPAGSGVDQCGGSFAGSSSGFDEQQDVVTPDKKSWIAIKLVDEDGKPISSEEYRIVLQDGTPVEGDLNKWGFACVRGIDPGTCKVTFPNLDKDIWKQKS